MPTVSDIISQILLKKLREEKLTPQEAATLAEWEGRSPEHAAFISMLMDEASLSEKIKDMLASEEQEPWQRIERALAAEWNDRAEPARKKANWGKYAVAASVVVLVGLAVYYFGFNKTGGETIVAKRVLTVDDVVQGGNKATLTLSDGKKIDLENKPDGVLVEEEGTKVTKKRNGELQYELSTGSNNASTAKNLLTTPRGGQFHLILPDSTDVWLNSASSIKYPVNLNSNERRVEITGEAYFKVTANASRKFVVLINDSNGNSKGEIEVMGTEFNVRAYDEEQSIAASLVEGRIVIAALSETGVTDTKLLAPGQQAQLEVNNQIRVIDNANFEKIVAWKNGVFMMSTTDINAIIHDISHWYNIEVVFVGDAKHLPRFEGIASRNTPLPSLIKVLQQFGIQCSMDNGTLIMKPQ